MIFIDMIKEYPLEAFGFPFLLGVFIFTGRDFPLAILAIWAVGLLIFNEMEKLHLRIEKLERRRKLK